LVTAAVVGHEVKSFESSGEAPKGGGAVEAAMNADQRGFGFFDPTFGNG
jgi:hypothetical protein